MAGIGFALKELTKRDDLLGVILGYSYSSLISTGPWIFTILSLSGINAFATALVDVEEISSFRIIVIYNFGFSLVFSGPILLIGTRYLADRIFLKNVEEAVGMMLGMTTLAYLLSAGAVIPFYGWITEFPEWVRAAAIINFFVIQGIWFVTVFVTALKDYQTVTIAFIVGMAGGCGGAIALAPEFGAAGMLFGFSGGMALIMFTLVAKVYAEYPYRMVNPFGFLAYFKTYWDLALIGLIYNLALWVDKWVMWFAPQQEVIGKWMVFFSNYDSAMFMAYLTTVPTLSLFMLQVETSFFVHYQRFYKDISTHVSLDRINRNHKALLNNMIQSLRTILILQGAVSAIAILSAPKIFEFFEINFLQIGIFRFGVLGAFFQLLVQLLCVVLAYFDMRKIFLSVQCVFLLTNGLYTWYFVDYGIGYYGVGYFLACVTTLLYAYLITTYNLSRLPYLTFVKNNPSI